MVSPVFAIAEGLECGLFAAQIKRSEDSPDSLSKAVSQAFQGYQALNSFAARVIETASLPQVPWGGRYVVYLTPFFLALFKDSSYIPEQVQPILMYAHNHLGTFYHLICIASSVTLLFYGQTLFAIPSLCVLGIELMDRNGWLPLAPSQLLRQSAPILLIVTSFIAGGVFERVHAVSDGFSLLKKTYFPDAETPRETFTVQRNLTPELMRGFFEEKFQLKLNRKFVHCDPVLAVGFLFEKKVLDCLREERTSWMRTYYDLLSTNALGLDADDFLSRHHNEFGLSKKATDDDVETSLLRLLAQQVSSQPQHKEELDKAFWEHCTLDRQTKTLITAIESSEPLKSEFHGFWQSWIERQAIDEASKEKLKNQLGNEFTGAELYDQPLELPDGKINPDFVHLLLLDMGIAEIQPMGSTISPESDPAD